MNLKKKTTAGNRDVELGERLAIAYNWTVNNNR